MEVLDIIKAYEILRSHGLDVSPLLGKELDCTNKKFHTARNVETATNPSNNQKSVLEGNTREQLLFLSQLVNQKVVGKEALPSKQINRDDDDLSGRHKNKEIDIQGEKVCTAARVSQGRNKQIEEVHNIQAEETQEVRSVEEPKKLENLSLAEILLFKDDVDEEYGVGSFQKYYLADIMHYLGLSDSSVREASEKEESDDEVMITQERATFADVLRKDNLKGPVTQKVDDIFPLKPLSAPKMAGGNIVVEIDEEEYRRGVEDLKFSVIGKLSMSRGVDAPTTMEIKEKLMSFWKIAEIKVIPLGRGVFHILLSNMKDQCIALAAGPIMFNPGVMRLNRWIPGYNALNKSSVSQVWVRIFNLPLEFRKKQNLFNIGSGIGLPIKIDPHTISLYQGIYARILIEVDMARPLPDRILITKRNQNSQNDFEFFVNLTYESLPKFCQQCGSIGHDLNACRRREEANIKENEVHRNAVFSEYGRRQNFARENDMNQQLQPHVGVAVRKVFHAQQPVTNETDRSTRAVNLVQQQRSQIDHQQRRPQNHHHAQKGPENQVRENALPPNMLNNSYKQPDSREKPWILNPKKIRNDKIDRLATKIMTEEAMKIITEAYESVFEGSGKLNAEKEDNQSLEQDIEVGEKQCMAENATESTKVREEEGETSVQAPTTVQELEGNLKGQDTTVADSEGMVSVEVDVPNSPVEVAEMVGTGEGKNQVQNPLKLTVEGMNEAAKSSSSRGLSTVHLGPRWMDGDWEEEDEKEEDGNTFLEVNSTSASSVKGISNESPSIASQLGALDPEKIYWNEDEEIYVHASGMCYDPIEKVYFTLINPDEGDHRPLYYRQNKNELKLAVRGELGQSNKIVLEDRNWNQNAIYTSLSVGYKPNLLTLFKDQIKRGRM